ncbi:MAG TPA: hypothetical protein VKB29_11185 [Candidatus Binataceae bacterium]|nr:hypothetical protein [Candidatus Binataceae bacterium]
MIPPTGEYRYEIRRTGETLAREETTFDGRKISGWRQSLEGTNRNEVEAEISPEGLVVRMRLRYVRGPFSRNASYEAGDDFLRGSVSALGGRNAVTAKLGRFREVCADFLLFRALTLGHVRERRQTRWTGRVVTIDSATLVATSNKQSVRAVDDSGLRWVYEPRMGDVEEIEIDRQGRVLCRRDDRGGEAKLVAG